MQATDMLGRAASHPRNNESHHGLRGARAAWVAAAHEAVASDARAWRWVRRVAFAAIVLSVAFIGLGSAKAASLDGTSGTATYVASNGVTNNLTVSFDGATYTFVDQNEIISADLTVCTGGGGSVGTPAFCPASVTAMSIDVGDLDDNVTLSSTGDPTTVAGGAGTSDEVIASANVDFTLANASLAVGGSTFAISGFEDATLTGGAGANTFDLSGWDAGPADLDGGGGGDVLTDDLSTGGTGFTLSDSSLTRAGGPTFSLSNFAGETANLGGGGGGDTFTVSGWTGGGSLSGAGGSDTVLSVNDAASQTITDTTLIRDGSVLTLTSIEAASLTGGSSSNTLDASGRTVSGVTLKGNSGNDVLLGTGADDVLSGGDGNDTLTGDLGDDTISGGANTDTLVEQRTGDVTISNSTLTSGGESDALSGLERIDISGGGAAQTIDASGFTGTATLAGAGGDDTLTGGSGSDTLEGGPGDDSLAGGPGSDVVRATGVTSGVLTPSGFTDPGLGTDTLASMSRANLTGTAGDDLIDASAWTNGNVTANGLGGNDDIRGGSAGDTLTGEAGNDAIAGNGGTDTLVETLTAAGSVALTNSSLAGSLGTDTLSAIERATIFGSAGVDSLSAGAFTGLATFDGRGSDDSYVVTLAGSGVISLLDSGGTGADGATVVAGPGADAVNVTATQVARGAETVGLSGIEERVVNLGDGNDSATVAGGHGTVLGGPGDDTVSVQAVAAPGLAIDGNEGSDATSVAFGNLAGPVSINDSGTAGTDSVTTDCTLPLVILGSVSLAGETVTYSGIEVPPCTAPPAPPGKGTPAKSKEPKPSRPKCTMRGTNKNDILIGTRKRDVICARKGDDVIIGLKGNDVLIGGPGNDILAGGPGRDELQGELGKDKMIGGGGIDRLFGGAGRDHGALEKKVERRLRIGIERVLKGRALKKVKRRISASLRLRAAGRSAAATARRS